ncbi:MAG: hypothetical protein P8J86_07670 [Phycisphaerales bacterium]|nr:hypothetical protein [Phycisphaerales bacterium]
MNAGFCSIKPPTSQPVSLACHIGQLLSVCMALILCTPGTGQAQTLQDLRIENQRLKDQIRDLTAQLVMASTQMSELLDRIEQMNQEAASQSEVTRNDDSDNDDIQTVPTDQETPSDTIPQQVNAPEISDESVMNAAGFEASPTALFFALKENYQQTLGKTPIGEPGSPENMSYLRSVRLWLRQVNHAYRAHVTWTVRIEQRTTLGRHVEIKVQSLDKETLAPLGHPFWTRLSASQDSRLNTILTRNKTDRAQIEGALIPAAQFDTRVLPEVARLKTTVIHPERPPVIGPYASFYYFFQPTRIYPSAATAPVTTAPAQPTVEPNSETSPSLPMTTDDSN